MELKFEEVHSRDCCSLECYFAEVVLGATVVSEFRLELSESDFTGQASLIIWACSVRITYISL